MPQGSRDELDCTFQGSIGVRGTFRHLIPRIEVKIPGLDPSIAGEEVEKAVREIFHQGLEIEVWVSLTKRPYIKIRKAYFLLEEARGLKLLKVAHIRIGRVSCSPCRKIETNRFYRCLGFEHMAVDCRGPDRSRNCWRHGEEVHTAGACTRKTRRMINDQQQLLYF